MLAVDRTGLPGLEALGGDAAWRRLQVRPPDLSHAERVSLGEPRGEPERPSARATADVRWYRAAQARHASSAAASPARAPASTRPVHAGVQAYQRTLAMDRE